MALDLARYRLNYPTLRVCRKERVVHSDPPPSGFVRNLMISIGLAEVDRPSVTLSDVVTAIIVDIGGPQGGCSSQRLTYQVLCELDRLETALPDVWVLAPPVDQLRHRGIEWPGRLCPFLNRELPFLDWNAAQRNWLELPAPERNVGSLLDHLERFLNQPDP